jgi:cytochrome P450
MPDAEQLVQRAMSPPFEADPYPVLRELRETAPMFESSLGFWFASDFASCQDVFRSPSVGQGFNAARLEQDPRFGDSASLQLFGRMLPFIDPPDHTRIRRILSSFFTPRALESMRPYVQDLVDRLLDRFAAAGGGDLVADYAENIPVAVICQLLGGMGEEDQGQCRAWAEGLVEAVHPVCDDEMMRHADTAAVEFCDYFRDLMREADGAGGDMMARLLSERDRGTLDEEELLATATTLVGAAYHNTRNHIAMGIVTLLRHPDQLAALREDPGLAKAAIEELLRFEPPVQVTLPRVALTEVRIGELTLSPGEQVCGLIGGANRDPGRYRDPERLDISRPDGGSLALAFGVHSCIGAAMARLEGEIAVTSFVTRFPRLTLLVEEPALDLPGLPLTRGFDSVPVEIG